MWSFEETLMLHRNYHASRFQVMAPRERITPDSGRVDNNNDADAGRGGGTEGGAAETIVAAPATTMDLDDAKRKVEAAQALVSLLSCANCGRPGEQPAAAPSIKPPASPAAPSPRVRGGREKVDHLEVAAISAGSSYRRSGYF